MIMVTVLPRNDTGCADTLAQPSSSVARVATSPCMSRLPCGRLKSRDCESALALMQCGLRHERAQARSVALPWDGETGARFRLMMLHAREKSNVSPHFLRMASRCSLSMRLTGGNLSFQVHGRTA